VSANDRFLEALLGVQSSGGGVDRKVLARLLLQAARSIDAERTTAAPGVAPLDPRFEELRRVLVGGEIEQLARLSRQIDDPEQFAAAVSRVLPNAIALADSRDQQRLGQVLAPTVERAAQASIRKDPGALAGIMQPVMLPAIRKSIGEAIDGTFQSLNESLKASLTWRGLRWRFEAWRAGKSYAEVVLQHSLVYQVEHAFLIHRHTGLLIAHAAAATAESQDPQLVSSMLAAIQDFVRDSFSQDASGGLDAIRLGDLLVWTEQGPYATLVGVIRGKPPESLHDTMRATLARIHEGHPNSLEHFDGDSTPLAAVDTDLQALVNLRQEARAHRSGFPWLLFLVVASLLALATWWFLQWRSESQAWQRYVDRLRDAPGLVVTGAVKRDGKWHVTGLRDPLAVDPATLLDGTGLDPAWVVAHWQPFLSLDIPFTAQRLRSSLDPPPTVTLELEGDRIIGKGAASRPWLQKARAHVATLPLGSPAVDLSAIRDINEGELGRLTAAIQSHAILFDPGEALPSKGQDPLFERIVADLNALVELSSRLRIAPRVVLTGHSDSTGKGANNLSLSVARSEAVRSYLIRQRGVAASLLAVRGAGMLEPVNDESSDIDRSINRRVSLSVVIDE